MSEAKKIKPGSHVRMHVRMTLNNDFVVEDTTSGEPLDFIIGDGTLEASLENALIGLTASTKQEIEFAAGDAFGMPDEQNIQQLSREQFSGFEFSQLQKGVVMAFDTPSGEQVPGMIIDTSDDMLTVDFNHPLSGKAFTIAVEILSID